MEPRLDGVSVHHLAVPQHVGAADVEGAVEVGGHARRPEEVVEDVAHGDRLDVVAHPARGGHVGEHVGQVPHHLERGRPGSDHDPRLEHDRGHPAAQQDVAHLDARTEVTRQLAVRMQPAEVHDPSDAGARGLRGDDLRDLPVGVLEPAPGRHRVDEVVEDVDVRGRPGHGIRVRRIAGDDLDLAAPREAFRPFGVARQDAHPVPRGQEPGHESAADVSRGAQHERAGRGSVGPRHRPEGLLVTGGAGAGRLVVGGPVGGRGFGLGGGPVGGRRGAVG